MIRVQQLRQKVELLRRVASIPTHGDGLIDRDLSVLADQLEGEADVKEEYDGSCPLTRRSRSLVLWVCENPDYRNLGQNPALG